ncbi:MAG: hypothetical protein NZO16_00545 [Deltaproteobacteria bacterium]|nr:hypothetical protein [Deltaproteobacteria bacterium]
MVKLLFLFVFIVLISQTPDMEVDKARTELKQGLFIDARDRLLNILKTDPNFLPAIILLMDYYAYYVSDPDEVLKYVDRAKKALTYNSILLRSEYEDAIIQHEYNAYSQKNQYEKALSILNSLEKRRYLPTWYASSKAWILFKLGRYDEAYSVIDKVADSFIELPNILNIRGILHGVRGDWEGAIADLKKASDIGRLIGDVDLAPVNNLGEVYEEIFQENLAIQLYEEAIRGDKDCFGLLSYINLSLLYLDFLDVKSSTRVIQSYKKCVASFPFKSLKAYISLTNLVTARIEYIRGNFEEARRLSKWILDYEQQLGSIGTDVWDLKVAAIQTLLLANQALKAIQNYRVSSFTEKLKSFILKIRLFVENFLYRKELIRIMRTKLRNFEDLKIRNTDSFLFYPFLGFELVNWPSKTTMSLLINQKKRDSRELAGQYYDLYLANFSDDYLPNLVRNQGKFRAYYDEALAVANLIFLLKKNQNQNQILKWTSLLYDNWPPAFPVFKIKLPVILTGRKADISDFPFVQTISEKTRFMLDIREESGNFKLTFTDKLGRSVIVRDPSVRTGLKVLTLEVFGLS